MFFIPTGNLTTLKMPIAEKKCWSDLVVRKIWLDPIL